MKKPDLFRIVLGVASPQLGEVMSALTRAGVRPASVDLVVRMTKPEAVGKPAKTKAGAKGVAVRKWIGEAQAGTQILTKDLVARAKKARMHPATVYAALAQSVEDKVIRKKGVGQYVKT